MREVNVKPRPETYPDRLIDSAYDDRDEPPLVLGGNGRSGESVENSAKTLLVLIGLTILAAGAYALGFWVFG